MTDGAAPAPLRLARVGIVADIDPDDLAADAAVIVLERRLAQHGVVADVHARTVDETTSTLASGRWRRAETPWQSPIDLVIADDTLSSRETISWLFSAEVDLIQITWCALGDRLVDEVLRLLDPSTIEVRRSVLKHLGVEPRSAVDVAVSRDPTPRDDDVEATISAGLRHIVSHLTPENVVTPDELTMTLRSLAGRHERDRRADAALLDAARTRLDELDEECKRLRRRIDAFRSDHVR